MGVGSAIVLAGFSLCLGLAIEARWQLLRSAWLRNLERLKSYDSPPSP